MSHVIQIPGGSATLRDELVSERHIRLVEAASAAAQGVLRKMDAVVSDEMEEDERQEALLRVDLTRTEATALQEMQDAAIVATLERWSLKEPLPTVDTVADLPREVYRALAGACTPIALASLRPVDFEPQGAQADASGVDFPGGGSDASGTPSGDGPPSLSTPTPPPSTESSPSVG